MNGGVRKLVLEIGLLVICLAACFMLVFAVHWGLPSVFIEPSEGSVVDVDFYPYPLHNDEWNHIARVQALLEENKQDYNPYLDSHSQNREKGFDYFLAGFFFLPDFDPVLSYRGLPALMIAINAFLLFYLVFLVTRSYWMGLAVIPFFAAIPSNVNLTGNWFFTPMTFSLSLVLAFFCVFISAWESEKFNAWLALACIVLLLASLFSYPFAAVVIVIVSMLYVLARYPLLRQRIKIIALALSSVFLLLVVSIRIYFWVGSWSGSIAKFASELVFWKGWTVLEHPYSLFSLGVASMLMALIGILFLVSQRKEVSKKYMLFFAWPCFHILNYLLFTLFSFSILMPYQRNLFYLMVSLSVLAGIGLCFTAGQTLRRVYKLFAKSAARRKRSKKVDKAPTIISWITTIFLIALVLMVLLWDYYEIKPVQFSLQQVITPSEYKALKWLEESYGPRNKILADPFLSITAYPVAHQRVVAFPSANLEGGDFSKYDNYLSRDCKGKEDFFIQEDVDFLLTGDGNADTCSFLVKVFNWEGVFIYKRAGQ